MKTLLENKYFYYVLSLLILIFFYGIYFIKMFLQRKKGIKTNQIGSTKKKSIFVTEVLMAIATYSIVIIQIVSIFCDLNVMPTTGRLFGFLIGIFGDFIFLTSVICMKDSWRAGISSTDETSLVTTGIYKYSRNPAFLGFDLMYIGILLLNFNILNVIFTLFAIIMLHLQILQEEKFMPTKFGQLYLNYKKQVKRYFGRIKKEK